MQVNDAKFAALRTLGYTGALPDMTWQWLQANGATSENISDAWLEMLLSKGITEPTTIQDGWFELLGILGYTGHANDRQLAFWVAGGVLPA